MKLLYVCKRLQMTKQYQQDISFGSVQAQTSKHKNFHATAVLISFHFRVFLLVF